MLKYILILPHPLHRLIGLSMVATLSFRETPLTMLFFQLPNLTPFILILFVNSDTNSHTAQAMHYVSMPSTEFFQ